MEDMWSYNKPENNYWDNGLYETREEAEKQAIEYAKEEKIADVEIGKFTLIPLPEHIDVDDILESLNQQYADEAGGGYDRDLYEGVSEDDSKWLEEEFTKLIHIFHERAKITPNWYTATNIYSIDI